MKFYQIAIPILLTWLIVIFLTIAVLDNAKKMSERLRRLLAKKADEEERYQDRLGYESEEERERTERIARDEY
jgi:hypothetical protein